MFFLRGLSPGLLFADVLASCLLLNLRVVYSSWVRGRIGFLVFLSRGIACETRVFTTEVRLARLGMGENVFKRGVLLFLSRELVRHIGAAGNGAVRRLR